VPVCMIEAQTLLHVGYSMTDTQAVWYPLQPDSVGTAPPLLSPWLMHVVLLMCRNPSWARTPVGHRASMGP
jgi:hypothetical protein